MQMSKPDPNAPDIVAGLEPPASSAQRGAPRPHMVKVKEVATGRVFAAWPVDARELTTHPKREYVLARDDEALTP